MATKVYAVDVSMTRIQGLDYDLKIQSFTLNAAVNSIPSISMEVVPSKNAGASGATTTLYDIPPEKMSELYSDLSDIVLKPDATSTITIKIEYSEGDGNKYWSSINLSKWMLSDVGMSVSTSYSAPSVVVVFSHPAKNLDVSGTIYESIEDDSANQYFCLHSIAENASSEGTVELISALYKEYAQPESIEFKQIASIDEGGTNEDTKTRVESFRHALSDENFLPGKWLECVSKELFMNGTAGVDPDDMAYEILRAAEPQPFGESTWKRLVGHVFPEVMLTVIPTYDEDKLKVAPLEPYAGSYGECILSGEDVYGVEVSPLDPSPLIGTAMSKSLWLSSDGFSYQTLERSSLSKKSRIFAFYFPEKILKDPNFVRGSVKYIEENELLSDMRTLPGEDSMSGAAGGAEGAGLDESEGKISETDYAIICKKYLQAFYLLGYRSSCMSTISAVPVFFDRDGNKIYPGCLMSVNVENPTSGEETTVVRGYLTSMVISADCKGKCSASYSLAYTRPPESKDMLVEEGTKNPCYDGTTGYDT